MYPDDPWLEAAASLQVELDVQVRDEAYEVYVAESARGRMVDRVGVVTLLLRCGQVIKGELRADDVVAALRCDGAWINGRVSHVGADHVDLVRDGCSTTIAVTAVEAWARR